MRRTGSVLIGLILAFFVSGCFTVPDGETRPVQAGNLEIAPPVVLSVRTSKQASISAEEGEYLFVVIFSRPMDRESVEGAIHIFKLVGNIDHGVNPARGDVEVINPPRDQRFSWSRDSRVIMVKANLTENALYYLYIASTARDVYGVRLDGRVGRDIDGDGIPEIFPFAEDELVTADNDYLTGPADFWSQPFLPGTLDNLDSYYYALPVTASFEIARVKELEYYEILPGKVEYRFMGNTISARDTAFSFMWPVKTDSLLELDFSAYRAYSPRANYWLKVPPLLIDPATLSSENVRVYDENYNFLTDARVVYNRDYGRLVPVPLIGKITAFPVIDPASINPDYDYYVDIDFGKTIPSHTLAGTYLVIEDDTSGLKYVLPVTDNDGNRIKFSPLYRLLRGRRSRLASNLFYVDNDLFSSGELDGMLVYSVFVNRDNEVFRIQSNKARSFVVARVSGNGNNIMDCTDFANESCSMYVFFDGARKNLVGKTAYITSDKFYLSVPSLEKGRRYFVRVGGGTEDTAVKDIWGVEISDGNYDGVYPDGTALPDNTVLFSFVTRSESVLSYPPTMRINDGSLYPYAVSGDNCSNGVCMDRDSHVDMDVDCGDRTIHVEGYSGIHFSFYTPDGDAGSVYGYNDFLIEDTVNSDNIVVLRNGVPLPIKIKVDTVVGLYDPSTPGKGGFPTSLVRVSLIPNVVSCDSGYATLPLTFRKGDILIIGHLIEALTSNDKRKFDGNGDGILEYSAVDDLKLEYDGERFVQP